MSDAMDVVPPAAAPADAEQQQQQQVEATPAEQPPAAPQQPPAAAGDGAPVKEEDGSASASAGNGAAAEPNPGVAAAAATTAPAALNGAAAKDFNFRKLEPRALLKYLEFYGLTAKPNASSEELAALVSKHFDKEPVDEDMVLHCFFMSGMQAANTLGKFDKKRKRGGGGRGGAAYYAGAGFGGGARAGGGGGGGGGGAGGAGARGPLSPHQIAKVDEEVAARPPNAQPADDSTAGWILARVAKYSAERDTYQVRDEEDLLTIPSASVIRLHDGDHLGEVQKGDTVLAVFPDTTSFYRAQVTKVPKQRGGEMHVKFDDDEDETGRTPHRRVPSRHVLKLSQVGGLGGSESFGDASGGAGGGERTRKGSRDYKAMISHALQKLPNSKGTLKEIFRIIETDFRDELQWKLEGEGKKTPMWKNQVRKLLVNPRSGFMFINAGERGAYYAEGEGGGGGGGGYGNA